MSIQSNPDGKNFHQQRLERGEAISVSRRFAGSVTSNRETPQRALGPQNGMEAVRMSNGAVEGGGKRILLRDSSDFLRRVPAADEVSAHHAAEVALGPATNAGFSSIGPESEIEGVPEHAPGYGSPDQK